MYLDSGEDQSLGGSGDAVGVQTRSSNAASQQPAAYGAPYGALGGIGAGRPSSSSSSNDVGTRMLGFGGTLPRSLYASQRPVSMIDPQFNLDQEVAYR
jgi:hypothetical protein